MPHHSGSSRYSRPFAKLPDRGTRQVEACIIAKLTAPLGHGLLIPNGFVAVLSGTISLIP